MSEKYKIRDQRRIYFVTFTVIKWIDVFIRDAYREIFLDSAKYCQKNKGLEIYAWCLMTSHSHMILGTNGENQLEHIIRDFKSFTSRAIRKAIEENERESRRDWMLRMMYYVGTQNAHNKDFQFWQQKYHPIELSSPFLVEQRLNYLHNNPVEAGFVSRPEDWLYSSAGDYSGEKGLLDIMFL